MNKLKSYITLSAYATVLAFSLAYGLATTFNLTFGIGEVLLLCVLCMSTLCLLCYNMKVFLGLLCVGILIIIGQSGIYLLSFVFAENEFIQTTALGIKDSAVGLYDWALRYGFWLNTYVQGVAYDEAGYKFIMLLAFTLLSCTACYIFAVRRFSFYVLLVGGLALFISSFVLGFMSSYAAFFVYLFMLSIYLMMKVRIGFGKKHDFDIPLFKFTLPILPVLALMVTLLWFVPTSDKPLAWEFVTVNANRVANFFNDFFYMNDDSPLSIFTAESDKINLGGSKAYNSQEIMQVQTPYRFYLRGNTFDTYNGRAWTKSQQNDTELEYDNDSMSYIMPDRDNIAAKILTPFPEEEIEAAYTRFEPTITYLNHSTKNIYTTYNTTHISYHKGKEDMNLRDDGTLESSIYHGKTFTYTMKVRQPNLDNELFRGILSNSTYDFLRNYVNEIGADMQLPTVVTKELLDSVKYSLEHSIEAHDNYTMLPEIPHRVTQLAYDITAAYETDYDKALAIEDYLSNNYTYTLEPPPLPPEQDFVDHFLFDGREGYCTYYATAMVVLARTIGLPARYVEGYVVPSTGSQIITNNESHAWPELYFEGVGWLQFEPTSPYTSRMATATTESSNGLGYETFDPYPTADPEEDYPPPQTELSDTIAPEVADENWHMPIAIVVVSAIVAILMLIAVANVLLRQRRLRRFAALDEKRSILESYYYYLRLLKLSSLTCRTGETAMQFASRVDGTLPSLPQSFSEITAIFEQARYGNAALSPQQKQAVLDFRTPFAQEVRELIGGFRYFVLSYFANAI